MEYNQFSRASASDEAQHDVHWRAKHISVLRRHVWEEDPEGFRG